MDEAVDQGTTGVAAGRVYDEIGLFIDSQNMIIFVEDVEGDRFGGDFGAGRRRKDQVDAVAGVELIAGLGRAAIDGDSLFLDESLNGGAGEVRKTMLEVFVDSALGQQSFDFQTGVLGAIVLERQFFVGWTVIIVSRYHQGSPLVGWRGQGFPWQLKVNRGLWF